MKGVRNATYSLAGAAALATFLVYLPALRNGFVEWDDGSYVVNNAHIRSLDTALVRWAFSTFSVGNWHPLTWISHALDYAVWGLNPLGHHLTNVILHAANTFLVVVLAAGLLEAGRKRATPNGPPSFLNDRAILIAAGTTGLLFGLHPLHVESVAWVAERKDLLCALFFVASILSYMSYASYRTYKQYLLALGFFLLALLSKPMAVTLPAVLLVLDWYPLEKIRSAHGIWPAVVEKMPFIALSLGSSALTLLAQGTGKAVVPIELIPLPSRALLAAGSLIAYLGKMLWPRGLSPYYPYPREIWSFEYAAAIVLLFGITFFCMMTVKKNRLWLSAWGYYVITLVPVIGIVQVGSQAMADRYTYLPSLGPFLAAGLAAAWLWEKGRAAGRWGKIAKGAGVTFAALAVAALSYLTVGQTGLWKDGIVLWSYVINREPERAPLAFNQRGLVFYNRERIDQAIEDFNRAIALNPYYTDAYNNRGMAFYELGMLDGAIEDFDRAIALSPSSREAYNNRGMAFSDKGLLDSAIRDYERAIALDPSYQKAYVNEGTVYGKAGFYDRAVEYFNRALAVNPNFADAYYNRAVTYAFIGRNDEALEDLSRTIRLNGNFAAAYLVRGRLYLKAENRGLAAADFRKACALGLNAGCSAEQALPGH